MYLKYSLKYIHFKILPITAYNVFSGTLNPTQSINQPVMCMCEDYEPPQLVLHYSEL